MIARKLATDLKHTPTGIHVASGSRLQETADLFAAKHGGRGIAGYEALINDPDVDAVYNSLPNGLHAEWPGTIHRFRLYSDQESVRQNQTSEFSTTGFTNRPTFPE